LRKVIGLLRDVGISSRRIVAYYPYRYLDVPEDFLKRIRHSVSLGAFGIENKAKEKKK